MGWDVHAAGLGLLASAGGRRAGLPHSISRYCVGLVVHWLALPPSLLSTNPFKKLSNRHNPAQIPIERNPTMID